MTVNLGAPLWQFLAVLGGVTLGTLLMMLLRQAAAHTCRFGHRMKRYVATRLLSYFSCPRRDHTTHDQPHSWATLATWHCHACDATGEDCLGYGPFWKVTPEGTLEVDEKRDARALEEPCKVLARRQKEQHRWLTHEEAYSLLRELVEAHRGKPKAPEAPSMDTMTQALWDLWKTAQGAALSKVLDMSKFTTGGAGGSAGSGSEGGAGAPPSPTDGER